MNLSTFDLNLLRALDVLLQEQSVTKAAEQLNVTQQAMSGSLKRLREQFDDELLVRVGQRFEPTPLGVALSGPMREVMMHIGRAIETLPNFDPSRSARRFRIAMSDYVALTLLPLLMAEISRTAPKMRCDIQLLNDTIYQDLDVGRLDFCVLPSEWQLYQENLPDCICSTSLFSDDFVCAVDRNHPIGETMTLDDYRSSPHNTLQLGGTVRSIVENAWTINRISPRIVASSASFTSMIGMVVDTPIIATVQRKLAEKFHRLLPIRIVECPFPIDRLTEDLCWSARNEADPAHLFLRQCFFSAAARLEDSDQSDISAIAGTP